MAEFKVGDAVLCVRGDINGFGKDQVAVLEERLSTETSFCNLWRVRFKDGTARNLYTDQFETPNNRSAEALKRLNTGEFDRVVVDDPWVEHVSKLVPTQADFVKAESTVGALTQPITVDDWQALAGFRADIIDALQAEIVVLKADLKLTRNILHISENSVAAYALNDIPKMAPEPTKGEVLANALRADSYWNGA